MKLIAFDPSSTCIGYAIATDGRITDAGLIKPVRTKDDAPTRIRDMRLDVCALIEDQKEHDDPSSTNLHAVIEWPSSHVHGRRGGSGAGLAVYGVAVGMVYGVCLGRLPRTHVHIAPNDWTRGRPKRTRLLAVKAAWPAWSEETDPGLDAADAISLALWFMDRQKVDDVQINVSHTFRPAVYGRYSSK